MGQVYYSDESALKQKDEPAPHREEEPIKKKKISAD
jgi:hypothetical protein